MLRGSAFYRWLKPTTYKVLYFLALKVTISSLLATFTVLPLFACFQTRHRNYWRSWPIGSLSRCQTSTITCLTFSTMRAVCTRPCRSVWAVQEVSSMIEDTARFEHQRLFFPYDMCDCPVQAQANPQRPHYTRERIKSQQVFTWYLVHNRYSLRTRLCNQILLKHQQSQIVIMGCVQCNSPLT